MSKKEHIINTIIDIIIILAMLAVLVQTIYWITKLGLW
jgi:hypothetical protein